MNAFFHFSTIREQAQKLVPLLTVLFCIVSFPIIIYHHFELFLTQPPFHVRRVLEYYMLSEWSINYAGGFIRRGLGGEIGNFFYDMFNIRRGITYFVISIFLYLFLISSFYIVTRQKLTLFEFSLTASPFMFFYFVNTASALGRKDVLLFALFMASALLLIWSFRHPRALVPGAVVIALSFIPIGLIHEGMLLFAPIIIAFLALAILKQQNLRTALLFSLFAGGVVALTFFPVYYSIADKPALFDVMCARLGSDAPPDCATGPDQSALAWIVLGPEETARIVATYHRRFGPAPFDFIVMLVVGTCLVAVLASPLRIAGHRFSGALAPLNYPLVHLVAIGLIALVPLFITTIDQGRFFQIYFTLSVLYCVLGRILGLMEPRRESWTPHRNWVIGGLVLVATPFFSLPIHYGNPILPLGLRVLGLTTKVI